MSDFNIDIDEMVRKLDALGGSVTDKHVRKAMTENMADLKVATVALSRVDTHTMEKSVYYRTTAKGDALIGEVGVTAEAEDGYPYPLRQHEDLTLDNGPASEEKPPYDGMDVGAKFLERPFDKYREKYLDNLAQGVQNAIDEVARR